MPKSATTRMPVFVPTDEQRKVVQVLSGMRMTHEEIAAVVRNPRTNRPIDRTTLEKAFAEELAVGRTHIKSVGAAKYYEKLVAGEQWAINFALKHFNGFEPRETTITVAEGTGSGASAEDVGIQVTFVRPKLTGHAE